MSVPGGSAQAAFARALALFQAGRAGECEALLRPLAQDPAAPFEALDLMGAALGAQGRAAEALPFLDRARELRPSSHAVRHNRAQALAALGRGAEARAELEKALQLQADHAPSWSLLANLLAAAGDAEGASRAYARLLELRPGFAPAHNNLALALEARGKSDEALAHWREAVRLDPQFADALSNLGMALRARGATDEAIELLQRAALLRPDSPGVLNNYGIALYERHRHDEAVDCYRRALALRPDFVAARVNLGHALAAQGAGAEAEACYRAAIAQGPGEPDAYSHLGLVLQEREDEEGAKAMYREALARRADHPDALGNLGYLLQEQGRLDEAIATYETALAANPASARAGYNLGLALLTRGDFERGWALHEMRFATSPPVTVRRPFPFPAFEAADWGTGQRLAIWMEQGVGDQLLYTTLVPELEARGQAFVLEADRRLVGALRRAHRGWEVVAPEGAPAAFASCTRHVAIGSLGRLMRPRRESFDAQPASILAADPARREAYRARLATPGVRAIAISWRSFQPKGRAHVQRRKSAGLDAFLALSRRDDLRLVDVQYGDTTQERAAFAERGGRLSRLEELDLFNDLDGVLAAIDACDAVVTTSNVTAHFAAALGKPTYLVYLGANPPFHYWAPRPDGRCLWYPSLRVVTGREMRGWDQALGRIDELLRG